MPSSQRNPPALAARPAAAAAAAAQSTKRDFAILRKENVIKNLRALSEYKRYSRKYIYGPWRWWVNFGSANCWTSQSVSKSDDDDDKPA